MSESFHYKEFDYEGLETLKVISNAENFNEWTYETIKPFCSGKILEIGSGIGNISAQFVKRNYDISLSDIRLNYRNFLAKQFPALRDEGKIHDLDLAHPEFSKEYRHLAGSFDTVFALNVIEHISNDMQAIANCKMLLKQGGRLLILVPAFQSLYNSFDRELFHYRRYNRNTISRLLSTNGLHIRKTFFFNAGGIPGWYISGKLQKNKTIPENQMRIFNSLVPVFKVIDRLLMNRTGLSVICVGENQM